MAESISSQTVANVKPFHRFGINADTISPPLDLSINVQEMQAVLEAQGLDFEGKQLRVAEMPTFIEQSNLTKVAQDSEVLHAVLEHLLAVCIHELRKENQNSPWWKFFSPYKKYFELIVRETRKANQISLMRFDALESSPSTWKFLETNTHCPGGVVHCGMIRKAYLRTHAGRAIQRQCTLEEGVLDSPRAFVFHLLNAAHEVSQKKSPCIVLATYRGSYFNELHTIKKQFDTLREQSKIDGCCIIADIRDLSCDRDGVIWLGRERVDLIYNKIDPLMIVPGHSELNAWFQAAQSPYVEFLNGLGASYITETKRTLATFSNNELLEDLKLSTYERAAIERVIPPTYLLDQDTPQITRLRKNQADFIVKPDALTRGAGVVIGKEVSSNEWIQVLAKCMDGQHVVQQFVDAPVKPSKFEWTGRNEQEFYGVDLFLLDGKFSGAVSRSHQSRVFNIGNGGKESVTLVVRDEDVA